MDNEKRAILAIVLSLLVLFIYQYLFAPPPKKVKSKEMVAQQEPIRDEKRSLPPPAAEPKKEFKLDAPEAQKPALPEHAIKDSSVSTSLYSAVFSLYEAGLKSFKLHRYMDSIPSPAVMKLVHKIIPGSNAAPGIKPQWKELINLGPGQHLPLRAFFLDANGTVTEDTLYQANKDSIDLSARETAQTLTFTPKSASGAPAVVVEKTFAFQQNDYRINLEVTIANNSSAAVDGNTAVEWTHYYPPQVQKNGGGFFGGGQSTESAPAKFTYFINGKAEKKEFKDITENKTLEGEILWTAFEEKYFISAVLPQKELPHQVQVGRPNESSLAYRLVFSRLSLKPGEKKTYLMSLYLGPKEIGLLEKQGSKLEKTINFGWFDIVAKPLLISLNFFYRFFGNYGIAIILITVIIKILFWPLTHKSFQSMKDMQKLQPEMQKLKEKYKDKKEELNREIMALYKKYNVNPLGGCLPILLQIPVFIALYSVLQDSIELRHANFISFWINDLAAPDPTYVSPLLMGASMFYQQKMTPSTADPAQAKMMLMMPIVFTFMFLNFPSGLVLYWLVNNVLSIIQQFYINKKSRDAGGSEWTQSKSKPKPLTKQSQ
jgi:YidC/Oxa1 family membrane protein insertase